MALAYDLVDLLIGFSVVAAALLWVSFVFFMPQLRKSTGSVLACTVLLTALVGLQLFHYRTWTDAPALFANDLYVTLLLLAPPSFYFFSRYVLLPDTRFAPWQAVHFLPVLVSLWLPKSVILVVAFALGAGYLLWYVHFVYVMRKTVASYLFELFFFLFFAFEAVLVFLMAISLPYLNETLFHLVYAGLTAVSLILIVATLIIWPEVVDDLKAAATLAYSKSTLDGVQVTALTDRLDTLMTQEKLYRNESLSLAMVADNLGIGSHQLSELVNVHHGCSFSTYIRRHRIEEAKALLLKDPKASVLSVGLSTGFRSQSNFYVAFKDLTGQSPGAFRKQHA